MHREQVFRKLRKILGRLLPMAPECKIEEVNKARIAYNPDHPPFIREYYLYCVGLFRQILGKLDAPVNVIFGGYAVKFPDARRTLRIDVQWEHTLVKPGGRDSDGAVVGRTPIEGSKDFYLVRIQNREYLETVDLIVEYSIPNRVNVAESRHFPGYLEKMVQVSPLIHGVDFKGGRVRRGLITLFSDIHEPRRRGFLDAAKSAGLPLRNVKGVYDRIHLESLYGTSAILVNVHQTDHHHTFEELRVLPALLNGVIVVSEDVPLREHVPYHEYVVWSSYEDLVETTRTVLRDYEDHYRRIFEDPRLRDILEKMRIDNMSNVQNAVLRALRS